jgi:hypothetical protein
VENIMVGSHRMEVVPEQRIGLLAEMLHKRSGCKMAWFSVGGILPWRPLVS